VQPSSPPITLPFYDYYYFYRCGGIHTKAPAQFFFSFFGFGAVFFERLLLFISHMALQLIGNYFYA